MSELDLSWLLLAHVSGRPDKPGSTLAELLRSGSIPTSAAPSSQGGRTSGSDITRDIELRIWGADQHFVYFYVGRWMSRYGDFGLGYTDVAATEGAASPWDSGAQFLSLKSVLGDPEAAREIIDAEIPIADWRGKFIQHLELNPEYFDDHNVDPFEVRRKTPHPIAEHLIIWAGDSDTVKAFQSLYAAGTIDFSVMAAFNECLIADSGGSWSERLAHAQKVRRPGKMKIR